MEIRCRRLAAWAVAVSLWSPALIAAPVPFWGAKESSLVGTDPEKLKPGEFIWNAQAAPDGPIVIVASLPEQIARVYRNGVEIGVAKVSTGKPGHNTPTGIFTILNKDKDHTSKTYGNAPMPYSERLTWDGVALHAGFLSPVSARGAEDAEPRLASGDAWRWEPEKSPEGPVTVVVSAADRRILVLRNGVEIGRAAVTIASPETPLGNEAFLLKSVPGAPANADTPGGSRWLGIALPGAGVGAGAPMDLKDAARVGVPPPFAAQLLKILGPGTTLYVTDAPVLAETTGPRLNVVNSDPPPAPQKS